MKSLVQTKSNTARTTSTNAKHSPVDFIRNLFNERKRKNTHYSLNAFARDIGLSPSLLSRVLSGSRSLTLKQGLQIATVLEFSQSETNLFMLGIVETASPNAKISKPVREMIAKRAALTRQSSKFGDESPLYVNYDIERFKTISQWYHLAILNLTFTEGFKAQPQFIADRLGITASQAKSAVDRLLDLGFLEQTPDGKIKKTTANLYFKTDRSEFAMREYQSQMIEKAKLEMQKTSTDDFKHRLINSITFACAPEHVALLKKKIDEFQDEVLATTKMGPHLEIYQLNCQLFPLTQPIHSKQEKRK
jgi:uncharacterized protein (TIGR02147 family)